MIAESEQSPIVVDEVHNQYGKTTVTHGVSFEVPDNSIFALLGSNGSGKTTLIRTIAGIISPSRGMTSVFGVPSGKLGREAFEKIGYAAEGQEIPLQYTLGGYLRYCKNMYPSWDDTFEEQLLKMFQLPIDRKLKHLSRGMLAKAQLITAMAHHPKLLILDEPFSGLDPLVLDEVVDALLDVTAQEKWTIFMSTHDVEEAERLADRIGILNDGSLLACLRTDEILERFRRIQIPNAVGESSVQQHDRWLDFKQTDELISYVDSDFQDAEIDRILAKSSSPRAATTRLTCNLNPLSTSHMQPLTTSA
jgi:ABC-2 type transport system ATP-binding protein